eukprot:Blabericola_migrator_1__11536@NODE_689_length_6864_cov_83_601000_g500_i0_p2_GENE_NODE_689_length_6864_cov_83_601000_g500_i0NODE_689_length_6864_cov_83_601000_g500_i0_p2_ORF_typecomplete_len680_score103_85ERremodelling/PF14755_6/3_4e02ERremodelling/PF14755_6/0_4_NODE_689_length_6864_cov_83_601000_g500_i04972536
MDTLHPLFPRYVLESQVLPNGLHVVETITSPKPPSLERPVPTRRSIFTPSKVFSNPVHYAQPNLAEGYAKLHLNITKGIAEMYRREGDVVTTEVPSREAPTQSQSTPPQHATTLKAPCCDTNLTPGGIDNLLGETSTPPFFPQFRVFLNDKAIYQTRAVSLEKSPNQTLPTQTLGVDHLNQFPSSPSSLSDQELKLVDVYDLNWHEASSYWIMSPASILTIQLIELDFCPDLRNSEDLLTSISIPLAPLTLNKPLDLILNVLCTLPHAYSLESLLSESERIQTGLAQPDTEKKPQPPVPEPSLRLCPPTALICKIHVSLTLEQTRHSYNASLAELAALSLPRGPWTPSFLVDEVQPKDQLAVLCGTEILATSIPSDVTVLYLVKQISSLVFTLTRGFDRLGTESVVKLLGHNALQYSLEDRKKLTYAAAIEDVAILVEYLVIGPAQAAQNLIKDVTTLKRPPLSALVFVVMWVPAFIPSKFVVAYMWALMLLFVDMLCNVHIPRKPVGKVGIESGGILRSFGKIQGTKMLVKPIESALSTPSAVRRIRLIEIWLGTMKQRVLNHELTNSPPSVWRVLWNVRQSTTPCTHYCSQFATDPIKIVVILALCCFEGARRVSVWLILALATLNFCRELPMAKGIKSFCRGLPRYISLRRLRRNHAKAATSFSPLSPPENKDKDV